jgi:hypothetical protein
MKHPFKVYVIYCIFIALLILTSCIFNLKPDFIGKYNEGYAPAKKNNKWGFVSTDGDVKVDFIYDSIQEFSDGMYAVCKDNKWGYMNGNIELVLDMNYTEAYPFYSGHAIVHRDSDYFSSNSCINKEGQVLAEKFEYPPFSVYEFKDNNFYYIVQSEYNFNTEEREQEPYNGKECYALIFKNKSNDFFSSWFLQIKANAGDSSVWVLDSLGWALLSIDNKFISDHYTQPRSTTCKNVFVVQFGNKLALLNNRGKFISGLYDQMGAEIRTETQKQRKFGFFDALVSVITLGANLKYKDTYYTEVYIDYTDFSEGLMVVKDMYSFGYIDTTGQLAIPCIYSKAGDFKDGIAEVSSYAGSFKINKSGEIVQPK